mgnify:CR=1 FL=1
MSRRWILIFKSYVISEKRSTTYQIVKFFKYELHVCIVCPYYKNVVFCHIIQHKIVTTLMLKTYVCVLYG